jgi:hypothetical protein
MLVLTVVVALVALTVSVPEPTNSSSALVHQRLDTVGQGHTTRPPKKTWVSTSCPSRSLMNSALR